MARGGWLTSHEVIKTLVNCFFVAHLRFASRLPSKIQRARCHSAALAKVPSTAPALRTAPWKSPQGSRWLEDSETKKKKQRVSGIPSLKLTEFSHLKNWMVGKCVFLGWPSFRCYVSFRECSWIEKLKMSEKKLEFRPPQTNMNPPKLVVCR